MLLVTLAVLWLVLASCMALDSTARIIRVASRCQELGGRSVRASLFNILVVDSRTACTRYTYIISRSFAVNWTLYNAQTTHTCMIKSGMDSTL